MSRAGVGVDTSLPSTDTAEACSVKSTLLFSGGVILVTLNFANVHLDTHAVLVGDHNLAAWHQLIIGVVILAAVLMDRLRSLGR